MDVISVTEETLRNAYLILQRLGEDSDGITLKCEKALSSELSSLDENFRADILRYIEKINYLKEKLKYCVDENMTAISDRLNKLPEYEKQTYKKINFVWDIAKLLYKRGKIWNLNSWF